jgi:hypothetical protein
MDHHPFGYITKLTSPPPAQNTTSNKEGYYLHAALLVRPHPYGASMCLQHAHSVLNAKNMCRVKFAWALVLIKSPQPRALRSVKT